MKISSKLRGYKIDWPNHFISFVSALFGIFLAFQLEDWQDKIQKEQQIETTLNAIKGEIERNKLVYRENIEVLGTWLEYYDFVKKSSNESELILASEFEVKEVASRNAERFSKMKFVRKYNDSLNYYSGVSIRFDVAPKTGISTSNWDAAKASGILNYIDHATLSLLSDTYDWINRDMGMNESIFYRDAIQFRGYDDAVKMVESYRLIVGVSEFKLERIEPLYDQLIKMHDL